MLIIRHLSCPIQLQRLLVTDPTLYPCEKLELSSTYREGSVLPMVLLCYFGPSHPKRRERSRNLHEIHDSITLQDEILQNPA